MSRPMDGFPEIRNCRKCWGVKEDCENHVAPYQRWPITQIWVCKSCILKMLINKAKGLYDPIYIPPFEC